MSRFYTTALIGLFAILAGTSVASADALFARDLYFGIQSDSEVTKLQEFLTDQGVYSGPITGNFFSLTLAGVQNFQAREGISPVAGYFGPLTRARANEFLSQLLTASEQQAISETGSVPSPPPPAATTGDVVSSLQEQINLLLQQVLILQQQLITQQQTQQTLQQIQQQTASPPPILSSSPSDTIAPVITAVQAINVAMNSSAVTWITNEHSDSAVFFGLSPGSYFSSTKGSVSAVSTGYLHTVNLSSLSADTTYYYQVVSTDSSGNKSTSGEFSFRTLPAPSGSVNASQNFSLGTVYVFGGQTNVKIGSYSIVASAASAVTINSVTVTVGSASSQAFQNMKVFAGGAQFGSTQGTVANGSAYSFAGTPFTINAGQSVQIDVYADILNASSMSPATTLSSCSGVGVAANNAVSCNTGGGQSVAVAIPTSINLRIGSTNPLARQIVMGSTGNILAVFQFAETSGIAKITDLVINQNTTAKSGFSRLNVYNNAGSLLASSDTASPTASGYSYSFSFSTPLSGSASLILRGDAHPYSSSNVTDNSTHVFDVMAAGVTALDAITNAAATVSGSASGNVVTILRSKLIVTAIPTGSSSGRSKSTVDDLGDIVFTADSAGGVRVGSVKITFTGSAPSPDAGFFNTGSDPTTCSNCKVKLYDTANGTSYFATVSDTVAKTLTFNLGSYQFSAGSSKNFRLRIDSANSTNAAMSGVSQTLSAGINAVGDVVWCNAWDANAICGLILESSVVPINIQSVSYAQGT
ncbi:MAG: hypothetical protein A3J67_02850 [Parcubacteria group bacterium RIFCSPHIGHO2_02_FULL_48_10b]|nr:MAG: hypothetical protein A3J67_02850 [Parcubacteria group bacterium RIFCSPHIGHO2_02_FULL_48_10b]